MIEIRCFQPGNVGRDSKQILEHRQRAAHDHRGNNTVANGESALHSDHAPVISRRIKPVNWPNQTERQRQQPDSEPDEQTGTDQSTAPSHLQRERDSCKSADQAGD